MYAVDGWGWCEVIFSSLVTQYNALARTAARGLGFKRAVHFLSILCTSHPELSFDYEGPFICTLHNTLAPETVINQLLTLL